MITPIKTGYYIKTLDFVSEHNSEGWLEFYIVMWFLHTDIKLQNNVYQATLNIYHNHAFVNTVKQTLSDMQLTK